MPSISVGNWVGEQTTTVGTGTITLGGPIQGFTSFASIGESRFWYAIVDGLNREAGVGTLSGGVLVRDTVYSTIVNGFYDGGAPDPISLSGQAAVYATFNKVAFDQVFDHIEDVDIHFSDAPADGEQYARVDNGWAVVIGGGSGSDHDDLTNVTADQHHPQAHAHNGVDGSGTVDYDDLTSKPVIPPAQTYLHADLTDVSPDQHHPQIHNLDSHSDVNIIDNPLLEGQGLWYDADTGIWRNRFAFEESWPTGLANGGELNIAVDTDIEVVAGVGIIVDTYMNPLEPPILKMVQFPTLQQTITAAPAVAGSVVWFSIAATAFPTTPDNVGGVPVFVGELKQYAEPPSPTLARNEVFLGVAVHNGDTWNDVSNPKAVNSAAETLRELATRVLPLSSIISGGSTRETGTFQIEQDEGVVWEQNRNWHNDKSDPNREVLPAQSPVLFKYVTQDFTVNGAATSTFDPDTYDVGGVPTNVPGGNNTCTIQKVYIDPANNYWCLYGQYTYPTFFAAEANLSADLAKSVIPFILQNSILLGYAVMEKGKNDWDNNEAVWIPAGGSGGGGGGGTPITSHLNLTDIGVNTHLQIDTHIADDNIHFADAPDDGNQYGRQGLAWTEITGSGGDSYWEVGTDPSDIVSSNVGNVGIGTADPGQKLQVEGFSFVGQEGVSGLLTSIFSTVCLNIAQQGANDTTQVPMQYQGSTITFNAQTEVAFGGTSASFNVSGDVKGMVSGTPAPNQSRLQTLTQAEYDLLTPDDDTLYFIVG